MTKLISLPGVGSEPEVVVAPWVIFEVVDFAYPGIPPPYRFVVGFHAEHLCGRVSTLIVEQDFEHRRVRTRSGRIYRLQGPPALDADASNVWKYHVGNLAFRDVTGDFWPGYQSSSKVVDSLVTLVESAIATRDGKQQ